jgi:hypothetical protein
MWKLAIVAIGVFSSMPAMGAEWDIEESDNFVTAAITGNITYGDRQRFIFKKGNCESVNHLFSTYTEQQTNF